MSNFLKTKWLAVAMLLCSPVATWADDPDGTKDNPFDLSAGDVTLPDLTADATYYITGDGTTSSQTNTILFPTTSSSYTYTIYLNGVTIDTSSRPQESDGKQMRAQAYDYTQDEDYETGTEYNSGIYIPASTKVIFYVKGENHITGKTHGIYAGTSASLEVRPLGEHDNSGEDGQVDITMTQIYITGGVMGIANEGTRLIFQGYDTRNGEDSPYENKNDYLGINYITANDCGIYSPGGLTVDDTDMTINVLGDGDVSENTYPTDYDSSVNYMPGYTINKLVCGIYVDNEKNDGSAIVSMAVSDMTIVALGKQTYGIFMDASNIAYAAGTVYMGYGTFSITATECVLHHEGANASLTSYEGSDFVFIPNGPFCEHNTGYWSGSEWVDQIWYCDGNSGGTSILSGKIDKFVILDGVDMDDTYDYYTLHYDTQVGEVEYVYRKLYAGWNTLCLPYEYDTDLTSGATDTEDENFGDETEARTVILKYADYNSDNDDTYGQSGSTITFTTLKEYGDENTLTLQPNTAYLVYLDDEGKTINDYTVVRFTAKNTTLKQVENHNSTNEIFFDPVFDKETMKGTSVSGDTSDHVHYKLTAHNQYKSTDDADATVYIDRDDNGQYDDTDNYTLTGVANYFNQTPDDDEGTDFPAYRCYIDINMEGQDSESLAKMLTIVFDDGSETTGINQLNGGTLSSTDGNAVVNVYGVNGQLVKVAAEKNATNGLSKGVYVVNGKKVVVM